MSINDVNESNVQELIDFLSSLDNEKRSEEFDKWIDTMGIGFTPNKYQISILTHFSDWLNEHYWIEDDYNPIEKIDKISNIQEELDTLMNQVLDHINNGYPDKDKLYKLLDEMNISLDECEDLNKFYNEKIINSND